MAVSAVALDGWTRNWSAVGGAAVTSNTALVSGTNAPLDFL